MAVVVIGMAASHAPNLATPSLRAGVKEVQDAAVKAGFAEVRALRGQSRPDAIVLFSTDHCDRRFYDDLPPFLVAVGEEAEGPVNEWLQILKLKVKVAGELSRLPVREELENGVVFASSTTFPLGHAAVVRLSSLTPHWNIPIVPIVVSVFAPTMPGLRRCMQAGAFVRDAIERWPEQMRVAAIDTGGCRTVWAC